VYVEQAVDAAVHQTPWRAFLLAEVAHPSNAGPGDAAQLEGVPGVGEEGNGRLVGIRAVLVDVQVAGVAAVADAAGELG